MIRIAVVEDDENIRTGIVDNLEYEDFEAVGFASSEDLQSAVKGGDADFDLYVLDIMLPGQDGVALCQWLRARSLGDPVLFLTARGSEEDKVRGFQSGGDDYMTKPFSVRELIARVRAILRRSGKTDRQKFKFADVEIDFTRHICTRQGKPIELTKTEFSLLRLLVTHAGSVVTRDVLLSKVWGYAPGADTRTVDVHVSHLRKKLEGNPEAPSHILTVRGIGYRLVTDAEKDRQ